MVGGPLRSRIPPPSHDIPDLATLAAQARQLYPRQANNDDDRMSAGGFFIPTLPGLDSSSTLTMYGGHMPSDQDKETDSHLYFFLIRNRHIADTERTIIWFNGGPGCSSFDGSLMEVGPLRLEPGSGGTLKEVEGAWNEYANLLFIDQPVGTGYSYMATNSYVHELPEASKQVVEFMSQFYKVFPEFSNHDTYIAGESYAGQYIPYFADAILSATAASVLPTQLKGLLIGNGWIDPYNQYPAYLDFALQAGVIKKGSSAEAAVRREVDNCMKKLDGMGVQNVRIHNGECENILGAITESTVQNVNGKNMCVNNYDVRLTDTHPACGMNWPPDLNDITPYLGRDDVKNAFHATRKEGGWQECNGNVGANFWVTTSKPAVLLLPSLLEKVPILFFAGEQDLICNHVGIERMIDNLEWAGETGFGDVKAEDWEVDGKSAGTWRTARGLTYVKVADASHMVPYDQPLASHDMVLRFLGVDLLGAAGPAAQVPSRVGDELEAVLGETHKNGTALSGVAPVSDAEKASTGLLDTSQGLEAVVNAGSALVIIVVMVLALGAALLVRRRLQRPGGGFGGGGKHARVPSFAGHRRTTSLPREEGPHEMDELVEEEEEEEWGFEDEERKGKGKATGRSEEEIFGLGDEEDDDDVPRRHH